MDFTTVNGNVIAEFTGEFGGDVEMSTVNGALRTDYEITVSGRLDPKHLRAHIGKAGGREGASGQRQRGTPQALIA